tara:strand:- start:710 stop:1213 length:504 start_codon:yes stop_codon:yes gene_type:complete
MGQLNLGNGANFIGGSGGFLSDAPAGVPIQFQKVIYGTSDHTTTSSSYQDHLTINFTPKRSDSVLQYLVNGVVFVQAEPGGVNGRIRDTTAGTTINNERNQMFRFDLQGGHSGNIYARVGASLIYYGDSWGTSQHVIKFQFNAENSNTAGMVCSMQPTVFSIMEIAT